MRRARAGGYRVVRPLGQGGAGTVYLALSPSGKRVALKVLSAGAGDDDLRRLQREGRLAARLEHPNIVRVHGLGMQAGRAYLVLDLVNGCSLQERLREGPLDAHQTLYLAEKLARALHYAHEEGILHRDLKPSNVLLDRAGEPRLTDFGLAKAVEDREPLLTVEGDVLGTPSYMAPEQALGEIHRVDRRADIYGLGATIYAMLTGSPPFKGTTWLHVLTAVVYTPAAPPSSLVPLVDPQLERICLRCLEKDPALRYPTALALAQDLSSCARRLRGVTPLVGELSDDAHTLRMHGSSLLRSQREKREKKKQQQRPLRPHGESERLLALDRSEPPLLLAGEKLRLIGESGERAKAEERATGRHKPGAGPVRRKLASRRIRRAAGLPLALALAPLALLALGLGFMLLGSEPDEPLTASAAPPSPGDPADQAPPPVLVSDISDAQPQPLRPGSEEHAPARPTEQPHETPAPIRVEARTPQPVPQPAPAPAPAPSQRDVPQETSQPAPTTTTAVRGVAILRRGAVSEGERTFAAGDTLPLSSTLRVGGLTAEIESEDTARIFLAPRTRFAVRGKGEETVFHVERGALFARSLGKKHYAIATPDGMALPVGTEFLVTVKPTQKTRVATYDGEVRLGGSGSDLALAVRRGFEAGISDGRVPWLPDAMHTSPRTLRWLPEAARPRPPSLPRILRTFTFDNGEAADFAKGSLLKGGALRSRWCLRGEPYKEGDGRSVVRREEDEVFALDSDLWIEAMCRTDCATKVTLKVWDAKKKKSVQHSVPVEPGRWTPIAVPLDALQTSSKSQTALDLEGPCRRFELYAGDCKDSEQAVLLVDNLRFYRQER